jgi:hypothetical protein
MNIQRALKIGRTLTILSLAVLSLGLIACPDGLGTAEISSVTIEPDSIPVTNTGMTDEYFQITIQTTGFTEEITTASAKIVGEDREAEPENVKIDGSTVVLENIAQSWFGGLGPEDGETEKVYEIEITVESSTIQASRSDLATITITQ